jgi:hypothetical protein
MPEAAQQLDSIMLEAALDYARRGYPVFPLVGKVPAIKGGHGCLDATTDEQKVHQWWGYDHPNANIGIATGDEAGFWVLDIDKGGMETLQTLIDKNSPLPKTAKQKTGSGFYHALFQCNGAVIKNRANDIGPGLDTRSNGGYIVAPPSIHPDTGKPYEWVHGCAPWETEPAEAPEWLIRLASTSRRERESIERETERSRRIPTGKELRIAQPYVQAAVDGELDSIRKATDGSQENTLNKAAFSLGQLVGAGSLDFHTIKDSLTSAGLDMPSYNPRRQWSGAEIEKKVERGLNDGMREPRDVPENTYRHQTALMASTPPPEKFEDWPEPDLSVFDESRQPAPVFPLEIFQYWEDWIRIMAESRSAPVDYVGTSLLSIVSTIIGHSRWVSPWEGWMEPPVIWTALIGIPSSGKSPALEAVLSPVRDLEVEISVDYPDELAEWETKKATAKEARDTWQDEVKTAHKNDCMAPLLPENAREPEKPVRPRIIVNDATIEALANILAAHSRGVLYIRDELAGWLQSFDRYSGGGDRPFWVEAYGGRPYTVDRVKTDGEPLVIPSLAISVTGGIQPDRLVSLLMKGDDDGLASRFLLSWPDPIRPKRPSCTPDSGQLLRALRRLREMRMGTDEQGKEQPITIMLSDDAASLFDEWRGDNADEQATANGLYLSHLGKMPGMVLRLALVLEHLTWSVSAEGTPEPPSISISSVGYAAHLVDSYFKPMAERAYGEAALPESERNASTLAKRIFKDHPTQINAREVRREWKLPGLKTANQVKAACNELVTAGVLHPNPSREGDGPGRNKSDFLVNPKIWRLK